jgi:hypothetical protein
MADANANDFNRWALARDAQDDALYERHGRPLERDHVGEFVAISNDGRVIVGADELRLAQQAVREFGAGAFALRRIGAAAEVRWRRTYR